MSIHYIHNTVLDSLGYYSVRLFGVLEMSETVLTFGELTPSQPDLIQSEMQQGP